MEKMKRMEEIVEKKKEGEKIYRKMEDDFEKQIELKED